MKIQGRLFMSGKNKLNNSQLLSLWRQFIPLSLSDVTMFFGDPIMNTTLAHLPEPRLNLAALGVAKSLAIFFESPIIMLLHASNVLAPSAQSRRALWQFMVLSIALLSGLILLLMVPPIFEWMGLHLLGIDQSLMEKSRVVLFILVLWPAAIGWRRYYQGILIHFGHNKIVGLASIGRLIFSILALIFGFALKVPGHILAGLTLLGGVLFEALFVTLAAKKFRLFYHYDFSGGRPSEIQGESNETNESNKSHHQLPTNLKGVWKFYWPLANSMLVTWGGRALLVGILARAIDGSLALAAWPVAWSLIILVANATRMVQQVIIRNRHKISERLLLVFAFSVGLVFSGILIALGSTQGGIKIVNGFVGDDLILRNHVLTAIFISSFLPFLVALQNAFQGFLISEGRTTRINIATWVGTLTLLGMTALGVSFEWTGVKSASVAVSIGLLVELGILGMAILPYWLRNDSPLPPS